MNSDVLHAHPGVHRAKAVLPVLFATLLIDTIGFGMVFPIIPIIFTDPTSSSFLLAGGALMLGAWAVLFVFMKRQ